MTPPCTLRSDALAQQLCLHLTDPQNGYGIRPRELDNGFEEVELQRTGQSRPNDYSPRIVTRGRGDGQISPPEIYKKIIELAPRQPRLAAFLRGKFEIPWIPSTLQTVSDDGKKLDSWMCRKIASLKNQIREQGLVPGSFGYTLAMGQGLFDAILGPSGLSVEYENDLDRPLRNPVEVYRSRRANCLEFTLLYIWAARKAGIDAVPVASYRNPIGESHDHIMVGFKNPRTHRIEQHADIADQYFGDPTPGEIWGEVPPLELWADWINGQGRTGMDQARVESYVDQALQMNPRHYLFLFNKGLLRHQAKDYEAAKRFYLLSIQSNPNHPRSYGRLHDIAVILGDGELGMWADERYFSFPEKRAEIQPE